MSSNDSEKISISEKTNIIFKKNEFDELIEFYVAKDIQVEMILEYLSCRKL